MKEGKKKKKKGRNNKLINEQTINFEITYNRLTMTMKKRQKKRKTFHDKSVYLYCFY